MKILTLIIHILRKAENASYRIIFVYYWKKIIRKAVSTMEFENEFQRDKEIGKIGERMVTEYYSSLGYDIFDVSEDTYYQYNDDIDLFINGISTEVKTQKCLQENKICIELVGNLEKNYQGWFYKTTAQYIIFSDTANNVLYRIFTEDLREYYYTNKSNIEEVRQWNPHKTSIIAFIPIENIADITERIEIK